MLYSKQGQSLKLYEEKVGGENWCIYLWWN